MRLGVKVLIIEREIQPKEMQTLVVRIPVSYAERIVSLLRYQADSPALLAFRPLYLYEAAFY